MPYILVIISALLSSSAHIVLKLFALAKNSGNTAGYFDYRFLAGMFLFGSSVVCGVVALCFLEFSEFYALTASNFLFISLFSCWFLGERMDRYKVVGNMVIVTGILVFSL
jgi:drug/metabolite transporter (DMT)-like permease